MYFKTRLFWGQFTSLIALLMLTFSQSEMSSGFAIMLMCLAVYWIMTADSNSLKHSGPQEK